MSLTAKQQEIIHKFREWTVKTFGQTPLFDCRTHTDLHGNTVVDAGNMHLSTDGTDWFLLPIDSTVFIKGKTLEECLLEGLYYAVERAFINTY